MPPRQTDNRPAPQGPQSLMEFQIPSLNHGGTQAQHRVDIQASQPSRNNNNSVKLNANPLGYTGQSLDSHGYVTSDLASSREHQTPAQHPQQAPTHQHSSTQPTTALQNRFDFDSPQHSNEQRRNLVVHFTQHQPARFLRNTQQMHHAAPGRETRGAPQNFTQHIPFRQRCDISTPRGHASSRNQPVQPIQQYYRHSNTVARDADDARGTQSRRNSPKWQIHREKSSVVQPPAPIATRAYLNQAHLDPQKLKEPKRLLVILDLNGTLMLKPDFRNPMDIRTRPGAPQLLEYLFETHTVMVYTSAQPHNAERVARMLFSEQQYDLLAGIWARDKLDLTSAQYREKVQVYKKLNKVWTTSEIQASFFPPGQGRWDQTNTILVDDSHLKALQEPHNLVQIPEFTNKRGALKRKAYEKKEEQICQSLIIKLETLKWQDDVSRLIFRWQTGRADIPRVPGSLIFVDEKIDQQEQAAKDLEAARNLPTPESPVTTDNESDGETGVELPLEDGSSVFSHISEGSESHVVGAACTEFVREGDDVKGMSTPMS